MIRAFFCVTLLCTLTAHLASAAQIAINNLSALHPIINPAGELVPQGSGFVQIGTIGLTDAEVMAGASNQATLEAAFVEFGTSVPFGAGGSGGFFSATIGAPIDAPNSLIGQNIYLVAGDGADLGSSDAIWIFKSDLQFDDDDPDLLEVTIGLDAALAGGEVLLGTPVPDIFVPLAGDSFDGSQMVQFIPEPHATLSIGIVSMILFGRRRVPR